MPRLTVKNNTFLDNNIEELDFEDNDEYDNESKYDNELKKKRESSQPVRTSFSGLDPKRLERRMKRPSSAPMKKQTDKENIKPHNNAEIDSSSVDLRKYFIDSHCSYNYLLKYY